MDILFDFSWEKVHISSLVQVLFGFVVALSVFAFLSCLTIVWKILQVGPIAFGFYEIVFLLIITPLALLLQFFLARLVLEVFIALSDIYQEIGKLKGTKFGDSKNRERG